MNTTSWEHLSGTTTLLSVQQNPTGYAPAGAGLGAGDQLIFTEDSIQVVDLRVVRVLLYATQALPSNTYPKGQLGRRRSSLPLAWTSPLDVRLQL